MNKALVWLKELDVHHNDAAWFNGVADEIYVDTNKGLNQYGRKDHFTELLISIETLIPTQIDLKRWCDLMFKAVSETIKSKNIALRCQIMISAGNIYRLFGDADQAERLYIQAIQLAHQHQVHLKVIQGYAGLLTLTQYHTSAHIQYEDFPHLLVYHRELRDPNTSADLYLAIANACRQWGRFQVALDYAQMAFAYWSNQGNALQVARAAKIIGECHLRRETVFGYDEAERWINIAARNFEKTSYIWQYGEISHLRGSLAFYRQEYDKAIEHLKIGIAHSKKLGNIYLSGILHHTLTCVLVMQKEYSQATETLEQAVSYFRESNSSFQILHTQHSRACIALGLGNQETAETIVKEALKEIGELKDIGQQQFLEKKFRDLINNT
ncbi:MAG: hypothetical protein MUF87_12525 [Anaerolineae bacterium]|jgi:tetratricopeptide (TPR) repeat protein|nr:hypothetical protein [Anaerolineae bacterium]